MPTRPRIGGRRLDAVADGRPEQARAGARSAPPRHDLQLRWPAGKDLNRLVLIGRICRRNQADKDETCGGRADRALQDRDEGHGDTPRQEARGEQLRCVSPYSSTRSTECRPGSKTCLFVSLASTRADGRDVCLLSRLALRRRSRNIPIRGPIPGSLDPGWRSRARQTTAILRRRCRLCSTEAPGMGRGRSPMGIVEL